MNIDNYYEPTLQDRLAIRRAEERGQVLSTNILLSRPPIDETEDETFLSLMRNNPIEAVHYIMGDILDRLEPVY